MSGTEARSNSPLQLQKGVWSALALPCRGAIVNLPSNLTDQVAGAAEMSVS